MNCNYLTTDVFTSTAFEGNPLAVVFNAEGLSAGHMQKLPPNSATLRQI